ncbi:helix-turn-helix domain-containing protein, partial [Mycoplasma sp. 5370]
MNYTTTKHYAHLNSEKRFLIEKLFYEQFSIRKISKILNVSHSTISREIKRNSNSFGFYDHKEAEIKTRNRVLHKRLFFFYEMNEYKEFNILFKSHYEKETCGIIMTYNLIKNNIKDIKIPSLRTVFNWINTGKWILTPKHRLRKFYVKGGKRKIDVRKRLIDAKYVFPMWSRPRSINLREEFGHWEADLVIG